MGIDCFENYQRKIYLKQHDKYVNCKAWILTPSYLVFDTARNKMNMTLNKNISFLAPGMFCYIENNKYFFSFDEKKKVIISCKNKHGWIWHLIYQKCYHKAFLRLHIIPPEICCTLMVLQEGFWPGKKIAFLRNTGTACFSDRYCAKTARRKNWMCWKNVYDDASICFFDEPESLPCSSLTGRIPSVWISLYNFIVAFVIEIVLFAFLLF